MFSLPETAAEVLDRESSVAQGSTADKEEVEVNIVHSIGLDQAPLAWRSLQRNVGSTRERSISTDRVQSQQSPGEIEDNAVTVTLKELVGSEHPDTLTTMAVLVSIMISDGWLDNDIIHADETRLHRIFRAKGVQIAWTAEHEIALDTATRDCHQPAIDLFLTSLSDTNTAIQNYTTTLPSELVCKIAKIYSKRGLHDTAMMWYRELLIVQETSLGIQHPSTCDIICDIAGVFSMKCDLDDAVEWFGRVLAGQEKTLGPDHSSTLETVSKMGDMYSNWAMYDVALEWCARVLEGSERIQGKDNPCAMHTVGTIGDVYSKQGRYDDALEWYGRALVGLDRIVGRDYPPTLQLIDKMGDMYSCQDRYHDALNWYGQALVRQERVLGNDYPSTLETVGKMGDIYSN